MTTTGSTNNTTDVDTDDGANYDINANILFVVMAVVLALLSVYDFIAAGQFGMPHTAIKSIGAGESMAASMALSITSLLILAWGYWLGQRAIRVFAIIVQWIMFTSALLSLILTRSSGSWIAEFDWTQRRLPFAFGLTVLALAASKLTAITDYVIECRTQDEEDDEEPSVNEHEKGNLRRVG